MLRSHTGMEGKSRKRGGHSVPDGKGSGCSVKAWRRRVQGKLKLILEALPEADRQRERENGLFIPLVQVRSDLPPLCPTGQTQPGPFLTRLRKHSLRVNFPMIRSRARAKNDSERTGSRTAHIFLNKVNDHPGKLSQYGC